MSIKYVKDDICNFTSWNTIIHCTNCCGVMSSGVALQIKNEFPQAFEDYRKAYEEGKVKLGFFTLTQLNTGNKIINACAQDQYGTDKRQIDYEAFYSIMESIKFATEKAITEGRKYILAVPYKIGSDRAGGAWPIVEAMLKYLFENSSVELYIVEYNKK